MLLTENNWTIRFRVEINHNATWTHFIFVTIFSCFWFRLSLYQFCKWSLKKTKKQLHVKRETCALTLTWPRPKTEEQSGSCFCKHSVRHRLDTFLYDRAKQLLSSDNMERDSLHVAAHTTLQHLVPDFNFISVPSTDQPEWIRLSLNLHHIRNTVDQQILKRQILK